MTDESDDESDSSHRSKRRSITKALSDPKTKNQRIGSGVLGEYKRLAQWLGRSEDTFIDFDIVFRVGMEYEASDDDSGDDGASTRTDTEREDDDVDQSHYQHVFTIISENIPTFNSDLKKFKKDPDALESLCDQMSKSLGFSRSDDIRILREDGLDYVASTQPNNDLMPDIPPYSSKPTYRGWNHPVLAELLCPVEHLENFRAHPARTIQNFTNGSLRVTADQLCLFMYRNYTVDYENLMDGLLCSDLIKMTWRRIFQNAKPATKTRRIKRKRAKPEKTYVLSSVTPRSIAYVTLHTRWFLSGVEDWRKNDGRVDKEMFYYTIIDMFKNKDMKDWSESVLQEWNKDMFQNKKKYETRSASLSALYEQCRRQSLALMSPAPTNNVNHASSTERESSRVSHHYSPPAAPGASRRSSSPAPVRDSRQSSRASRPSSPSATTRATRRRSPPAPNRASHARDTESPPSSPSAAAMSTHHSSVRALHLSHSPASIRAPRQSTRLSRASSNLASARPSRQSSRVSSPPVANTASASHLSALPASAESSRLSPPTARLTFPSASQPLLTLSFNIESRPSATTSKRRATSPDSHTFPSTGQSRHSKRRRGSR
ncbi:hypothetical protein BGW80DRAFT_1468721 [Lactifluus volemus]|nr:hypothetical protein BGW80DRAFT_1468721 [Lactifluus volemus]